MSRFQLIVDPRRQFGWLLLLALLLPMAQTAAMVHVQGHPLAYPGSAWCDAESQSDDCHSVCDLCLIGAASARAAAPSGSPFFVGTLASYATMQASDSDQRSAQIALPYQSRAPPPALR